MKRTVVSVAIVAALVLAVGACSKSNDTNTPATQAPSSSAKTETTKSDSGGTTKDTKSPSTSAKGTATTKKSSTGSTTGGGSGYQLTPEQQKCVGTAAQEAASSDPEIEQIVGSLGDSGSNLTPAQALVLSKLIVECVPKAELVDGLMTGLKSSKDGQNISKEGLDCIQTQILALDRDELAPVLAILVIASQSDDRSLAAPVISKLNQACNTSIPA